MLNDIGDKLKFLRRSKGYTQKDLGNLLNVGQTTIANYENGSRVPDLLKIKDISNIFQVSSDYLLGLSDYSQDKYIVNTQSNVDFSELVYHNYIRSLINGDKDKSINICLSLLDRGMDISKIYESIIAKSLKETGSLWERGTISVWKEHMISEMSKDIIAILHSKYNKIRKDNKVILGLTPGAEAHNMGIKMVCSIFELIGWKSIYLGSNVPTLSVLDSIYNNKPNIIALSVTISYHIESAKNLVDAIRELYNEKSLSIIVGGNGLKGINVFKELKGINYHIKDFNDLRSNLSNFD